MELIAPYGGALMDLFQPAEVAAGLASIGITERSRCDLELLATGAFSPLDRLLSCDDYHRVLDEMRLANGTLFPIPITLPVDDDAPVMIGSDVVLRGSRNEILAVMTVEEIFDRRVTKRSVLPGRRTRDIRSSPRWPAGAGAQSADRCVSSTPVDRTIFASCDARRAKRGPCSTPSVIRTSWCFRPATRCIVRTKS